MKRYLSSRWIMFMAFVLIIPFIWNVNTAVAEAATPAFVQTKVNIIGTGETFQLEIKNKVSKSTYKWTTSNKNIANVTKNGLITSINKGTTTIKCVITYPTKKTKTLSCKVTVTIPATEIEISNTTLINGAQRMDLGDSKDFDYTLTPANSSDQVYWSIYKGDKDCIRIDDAVTGKITAIKAGKVVLKVTAATTSTKAASDLSIVDDAVIIEVVGPSATVNSVTIMDPNTIVTVFDSAINSSTVVNANGTLSSNIDIGRRTDTKKVLADDPGTLKASLSADGKTLTITSEKVLNGNYGINYTNNILTRDGIALVSYYKQLSYTDTEAPVYIGTIVDDTGYIATINFSETMDFSKMVISGATTVGSTVPGSTTTLSIMNNEANYTVSADKKSLSINLSTIATADYNKMFTVYISGATDAAGNAPANVYYTVNLNTNTTAREQAVILSVIRSGYNVLTVTYSRAISFGGMIQIAGGNIIYGVVDSSDNKKVNYTMSTTEASYIGNQVVQIGHWNSYNVLLSDTSANSYYTRNVNFSADSTSPTLITSSYDIDTKVLTLTYNESVSLASNTGTILSTYNSATEEVKSTNLTYSKVTHTESTSIIKLQMTNMSLAGTYNFTLPAGFVLDAFNNGSLIRPVIITNGSSTSTELPSPYTIYQDTTNLSKIYVKFALKVDKTSAETVSNYKIAGLTILSATLTDNSVDTGATVALTVADSSIAVEVARPMTISGVKGYNNGYAAIALYTTTITLKENLKPFYMSAAFDVTTKNRVALNFSEAVSGTLVLKVTQIYNSTAVDISGTVTFSGNYAYINLLSIPTTGSYLKIDVQSVALKDSNGNSLTILPTPIMVPVSY